MKSAWNNTRLIAQSRWRVVLLHLAAKALGVLCHVEGIPFGSNRIYPRSIRHELGDNAGASNATR